MLETSAVTRSISPSMDLAVIAEIDARLDGIERDQGVRILFAIESGSRAWGFPSPDSDYDCRFVYLRPETDYLSLFPTRDVIETELTPVFDVGGWDLAKAIKLLLGGNAVIIEWLTSPLVYRAEPQFRESFLSFARQVADRNRIAIHYLHLAKRQLAKTLDDPNDAPLKKVFYTLRPAIALRWLRLNPTANVAPMNFAELCGQSDLEPTLQADIDKLLAEKAVARELGRGPIPQAIRDVIESELSIAGQTFYEREPIGNDLKTAADKFFRRTLQTYTKTK